MGEQAIRHKGTLPGGKVFPRPSGPRAPGTIPEPLPELSGFFAYSEAKEGSEAHPPGSMWDKPW